jgi:hypothetical protein
MSPIGLARGAQRQQPVNIGIVVNNFISLVPSGSLVETQVDHLVNGATIMDGAYKQGYRVYNCPDLKRKGENDTRRKKFVAKLLFEWTGAVTCIYLPSCEIVGHRYVIFDPDNPVYHNSDSCKASNMP